MGSTRRPRSCPLLAVRPKNDRAFDNLPGRILPGRGCGLKSGPSELRGLVLRGLVLRMGRTRGRCLSGAVEGGLR
jgi:hypothetical protein